MTEQTTGEAGLSADDVDGLNGRELDKAVEAMDAGALNREISKLIGYRVVTREVQGVTYFMLFDPEGKPVRFAGSITEQSAWRTGPDFVHDARALEAVKGIILARKWRIISEYDPNAGVNENNEPLPCWKVRVFFYESRSFDERPALCRAFVKAHRAATA